MTVHYQAIADLLGLEYGQIRPTSSDFVADIEDGTGGLNAEMRWGAISWCGRRRAAPTSRWTRLGSAWIAIRFAHVIPLSSRVISALVVGSENELPALRRVTATQRDVDLLLEFAKAPAI